MQRQGSGMNMACSPGIWQETRQERKMAPECTGLGILSWDQGLVPVGNGNPGKDFQQVEDINRFIFWQHDEAQCRRERAKLGATLLSSFES